ncbi:hypothetical protein ACHWUR_19250 [Klebsiella pneumoniae]
MLRDGRLIESGPMGPLSGEQIVEKMLGHELRRYLPAAAPPHGEEVLLQVDGLHDEALLQDISLRLRKGKSSGSPGWPARAKPSCASAVRRQQKPGAAGRAERPAVATARSGRLGGARPGAGPGGATQRGHFH